ncbi:tetratricopeptide repeat protein [Evansella sp. AB-rgal1]|uniref:tetratricopeptide repeat protein n=1 Tax=Evansella sp. AB-rgal1 TaxID=3242696 RepID=UPI00359E26CA
MGNKSNGNDDNNVILFPGLVSKLIEKGMSSLKEKKFYDALQYFQESTELEPTHPQARYGLVITNIELNRLTEAKKHCESMLREGIGQYYEVLQVYVSILIQLGDYQEVEVLLETVISEEKLPAKMAESFYQLLNFSRQMTKPSVENEEEPNFEETLEEVGKKEEWLHLLEQGELDQQWGAIQKLSQINSKDVEKAYKSFLLGDGNPVLKSYILQMLKELNIKGTIEVHKFGETFTVDVDSLEDVFHEQFGTNVIKKLDEELGQDSPSLFEMVQQVWWHFLFALYPKAPKPTNESIWAASLHMLGTILMNDPQEVHEIAERYLVSEEEVTKAVQQMKEIESHLFMNSSENT